MTIVPVWVWQDGSGADGAPIIKKALALSEDRPPGVPADAQRVEQDAEAWIDEIVSTGKDRRYLRYLAEITGWAGNTAWTVTARQIRLALNQVGLRETVETAVAGAGRDIQDYWEYSIELDRWHPIVADMLRVLDLDETHADAVWALAETL